MELAVRRVNISVQSPMVNLHATDADSSGARRTVRVRSKDEALVERL